MVTREDSSRVFQITLSAKSIDRTSAQCYNLNRTLLNLLHPLHEGRYSYRLSLPLSVSLRDVCVFYFRYEMRAVPCAVAMVHLLGGGWRLGVCNSSVGISITPRTDHFTIQQQQQQKQNQRLHSVDHFFLHNSISLQCRRAVVALDLGGVQYIMGLINNSTAVE